MAIWQFECYIVSKKKCIQREKLENEDMLSWKKEDISCKVDFLEKQLSWTEDIIQYGLEDETCIQFMYEDGLLEEVCCRLDLRSLSKNLLERIMNYIQEIEGMIFYEGNLYSPCVDEIIELLKSSKANKFCEDSTKYFEELAND